MAKTADEEKSDGIEIMSIGKLYAGSWDKKYWSSSRGKDRYPYPVGYKLLRTQNGVTYKMEILEGLKGPSFMISSTDGKSCSGDTPDIAWERFQKKGCSKLWHGKRFSCKIDGVEFFGFKNSFVQRLLRELIANVGRTAEQSLPPSNSSIGVCETVCQSQCKASHPDPNLLKYLEKSHVTGKRSRKDKVVNNKRLNGTHVKKHLQEKCTKIASASNSKQRDQSNCGSGGPSTLDMSDHFKVGGALSQEERELTSSINHPRINVDNLPQKREPSDRSRNVEVQECINLTPEERGEATNVQHGMPVINQAHLYAPDSLDHTRDSSSVSSLKNDVQVHWILKDAIADDVAKSEVLVTDSLPEDELGTSAYKSSEKCDTDSVGQEIAKSMMTVLLPRALPLLKTFTRKKKKCPKPSEMPTHRSHEENKMLNISMNDATIARELAEHSDLERKNEKACIPCDSVVSTSGNLDSVVPDSFDNNDPQDLLSHAHAAKAGQASCGLDPHVQLPINVNAEENPLFCHIGIREHDINLHYEGQAALTEKAKKDTGTAVAAIVATTDAMLVPVKEIAANSKRARFDCRSMDKLPSIRASTMKGTYSSENIMCKSSSDICMLEISEASFAKLYNDADFADCDSSSSKLQIPSTSYTCSMTGNNKTNDDSGLNVQQKVKLNSKIQGLLELFACYVHPMPISSVQLIVKENEIFICVKCGYSEQKESTLFVYKVLKNGEKMGSPSLIGHLPIALQVSRNVHCRDIAAERSLLQLTPDAQSLVLLNSIRTPYCWESKLHCSCPACTSDCLETNAVKIVRLNSGYASLVTRLETTEGVCCLLVCEPCFLLAAEEGGKLKLWVMNSGWSAQKEECYLPTFDCMFPSIVELKKIPKSDVLVVGHNGFGEFCLWDIDKRNLVSRFSSPGLSVLECVPASILRWQRESKCEEVLIDEIMDATKMWFSGRNENHIFSPEDKDVAVWLLISTVSDRDSQCYQSCEQEANLVRCWRLALLVNNTVIIGSAIDGGFAAVTSVGHGIIGRCDGLVYVWELSTGTKLGNLHSFKGSRVTYIATDTSDSGALAIASEGQLLVYQPS